MEFVKMQGAGNDFVVIESFDAPLSLSPEALAFLADRRFGVGCDQILAAERPEDPVNTCRYRIFNADGSEAAQCGNGARCLGRFLIEHGRTRTGVARLETPRGVLEVRLLPEGAVLASMGEPAFAPESIPFRPEEVEDAEGRHALTLADGRCVEFFCVSLGNPHIVLEVEDVDRADVAGIGAALERHPAFPERTNVEFVEFVQRDRVRMRVWERGAGETESCGSGASAAAAAGIRAGRLGPRVRVETRGGVLGVEWEGTGAPLYLSGPAEQVFEGRIDIPEALLSRHDFGNRHD